MKKDCIKFKKHEESQKEKKKNVDRLADSVSVAQKVSRSSDGELVLVSASSRQFDDTWIMDSRCTYHMCPN